MFRLRNIYPCSSMTPPRTVLDDLPFCLAQTSLVFRRFGDHALRASGLESQAPGRATLLHALDEFGDSPVNVLVEKSRLPNGTVTGLLDALEDENLIRRTRNPDDGRSWIVGLTPQGERVCAKLRTRHRRVMSVFGEALSPSETGQLVTLLTKLSSHLDAYVAARESRGRTRGAKRSARSSAKKSAKSPKRSRERVR